MEERPQSEHSPKKSISEVKIKGEWKIYGLMSKSFNTPYQQGRYLGTSTEIMLDGFGQNTLEVEYHFWEKADDK